MQSEKETCCSVPQPHVNPYGFALRFYIMQPCYRIKNFNFSLLFHVKLDLSPELKSRAINKANTIAPHFTNFFSHAAHKTSLPAKRNHNAFCRVATLLNPVHTRFSFLCNKNITKRVNTVKFSQITFINVSRETSLLQVEKGNCCSVPRPPVNSYGFALGFYII